MTTSMDKHLGQHFDPPPSHGATNHLSYTGRITRNVQGTCTGLFYLSDPVGLTAPGVMVALVLIVQRYCLFETR